MVLTVDTAQVPVDKLARIDHVERIHANFDVEATSGTAGAPSPATVSTEASAADKPRA